MLQKLLKTFKGDNLPLIREKNNLLTSIQAQNTIVSHKKIINKLELAIT